MIGGSYRVAVDAVVFGARPISQGAGRGLEVLLVQRGIAPFKGGWALPGGKGATQIESNFLTVIFYQKPNHKSLGPARGKE